MTITYTHLDKKNKRHSIANVDGVEIPFWYELFNLHGEEQVEAYLQAEVLRQQDDEQGVLDLITPYMGGENTYKIEHIEDEDGNLVSVESGADTRTWLQIWYDAYYG
jgi:hypothetical protein